MAVGQPQQRYSQAVRIAVCVGSSGVGGSLAHRVLAELWGQWISQHRRILKLERGRVVLLTAPH